VTYQYRGLLIKILVRFTTNFLRIAFSHSLGHERTFDKVSQESLGSPSETALMARLFFLSKFALLANQIRLNRRDVFHC
jgi:hypothetical protein